MNAGTIGTPDSIAITAGPGIFVASCPMNGTGTFQLPATSFRNATYAPFFSVRTSCITEAFLSSMAIFPRSLVS